MRDVRFGLQRLEANSFDDGHAVADHHLFERHDDSGRDALVVPSIADEHARSGLGCG